jgi:hypothetical protein
LHSDLPTTAAELAKTPKVNWSALQNLFLDEGESHVLLLLDDCFAGSIVQWTEGSKTLEAIVATGFDGVAPLQGKDSFTRSLTDTLRECRSEHKEMSVSRLCALVAARLNQTEWRMEKGSSRRVTPQYLNFSNANPTIRIHSLGSLPSSEAIATNDNADGPNNELIGSGTQLKRNAIQLDESGIPGHEVHSASTRSRQGSSAGGIHNEHVAKRQLVASSESSSLQVSSQWLSSDTTFKSDSECVPAPGEIRMVHLHASPNYTDPISLHFTVHDISSIEDVGHYTAISWLWSTSQDRSKVQVRVGTRTGVREIQTSLAQALRRIRKRDEEVVVWADQLCIFTESYLERTRMVPLIPTMFRKAGNSMVWLGDGDSDCETAMELIPHLVNLEELDNLVQSEKTPARWHALVKLLENPALSRRWIFGEIMITKHAFLYCGERVVSWYDFCDAITTLGSRYDEIRAICKRLSVANG